jgi:hypothetical protein
VSENGNDEEAMKRIPLVVLLLCSALAWAGSEPNPSDYTINVHVSSSHVNSRGAIRLKVILDGKKCELEGIDVENSLLIPGDYKAKSLPLKVKDVHTYDVYGNYEIIFPDNKTRRYALVGIME